MILPWKTKTDYVYRGPWKKKWQHTPVFLPGKVHGQRSLAGYRPWGRKESDTTEQLTVHDGESYFFFSLQITQELSPWYTFKYKKHSISE